MRSEVQQSDAISEKRGIKVYLTNPSVPEKGLLHVLASGRLVTSIRGWSLMTAPARSWGGVLPLPTNGRKWIVSASLNYSSLA